MTGIDVDALAAEFAEKRYEKLRIEYQARHDPLVTNWRPWQEETDQLRQSWIGAVHTDLIEFVAARVEQDVADRIERALFGDTDGGWVSDDVELPVGELRRLLGTARGGSDD